MLQDWLRLTGAKVWAPTRPRDGTRFFLLARPPWLWRIRFESRRAGGLNLNLKGAGIRKHTTTGQMSQLPRTIRPETYGNLTRALDF